MSEAYMTVDRIQGLSEIITILNDNLAPDNWWQVKFNLGGPVTTYNGDYLGRIEHNKDENAYVFVPGGTYEPYEPTDRGE